MRRRVIFLLETAFSQRDYHCFGFDMIQSRGYEVEAWDPMPLLKPDYFQNYTPPNPSNFGGQRQFTSAQELTEAISSLAQQDVILSFLSIDPPHLFVYRAIEARQLTYGFQLCGLLPSRTLSEILRESLPHPALLIQKGVNLLQRRHTALLHARQLAPSFLITGGRAAEMDGRYPVTGATQIIKAHALDYDAYLAEEKLPYDSGAAGHGYAVFLDEGVSSHPDGILFDVEPYCAPDRYYAELNTFFDRFEQATGLPIIVAGHPRVDYAEQDNPFGGRKIVSGETVRCVRHASLAFAHDSTACNFAVIYAKPLLFLDSDSYKARWRSQIRTMAAAVGQPILKISGNTLQRISVPAVNDAGYARYKDLYIKESGTPEKMTWHIFCDWVDHKTLHNDPLLSESGTNVKGAR